MRFICALACLLAGLIVCPNVRADADPMLRAFQYVLATVAQATPNEHLRKHAGAKVRDGKNPDKTPYTAGSVSLEAQRTKDPSIYPRRGSADCSG